ncbi:hypothetical protein [Burkholderia sp. NLJ2]|uniref:hypothetical protein n=1 Tax=Burkholderia sp. NLJ2 TaxID=3090699 RepID=UPI003C6C1663
MRTAQVRPPAAAGEISQNQGVGCAGAAAAARRQKDLGYSRVIRFFIPRGRLAILSRSAKYRAETKNRPVIAPLIRQNDRY